MADSIKGRALRSPKFVHGFEGTPHLWIAEPVDDERVFWSGGPFASEEAARTDYAAWLRHQNADPEVPEWQTSYVDARGKMNPKVIVRDCVAACPELERAPLIEIVTAVIESAGATLKDIEKEIGDAGSMTPNVAAVLMGVGAVYEISKQLPGTRGKLVDAGQVVGRAMGSRFKLKIQDEIDKRDGGN